MSNKIFNVFIDFNGDVSKIGSKYFNVERIRSGDLVNPNSNNIDEFFSCGVDVITTGKSALECCDLLKKFNACSNTLIGWNINFVIKKIEYICNLILFKLL